MNLKEVKKDVIYTTIGDRLAIPKANFEWLIKQAEKVEELEKKLKGVVDSNYCVNCGDDATEYLQGSYYCDDCSK